jgi:hypothetical protein
VVAKVLLAMAVANLLFLLAELAFNTLGAGLPW